MKRLKRTMGFGLLGLLILVSLLGDMGQALVLGFPSGPLVLARVEVTGMVEDLGLPVYVHLQDAAGKDYALVITAPSQLEKSGAYTILDAEVDGTRYLVGEERRPGARKHGWHTLSCRRRAPPWRAETSGSSG
jgi:hypothetical protein